MRPSGHGISLKAGHYPELLSRAVSVEWAEAVTENFLGRGGRPLAVLEHVRRDAKVILHGVSMSLGGCDAFDRTYFSALRALSHHIQAAFISDHLCFGSVDGLHGHDLWPLPYNEEALSHVARRIRQAQDLLETELVIENVASYVRYSGSELTEAAFVAAVLEEANAGMLLDVNNVFVSAHNHGFDAYHYIDTMPPERIRYIHVAGHVDLGTHLLDNHGAPVCDSVWQLYEYAIARLGPTPTIVEWDSHLPPLRRLLQESERAQLHEQRGLSTRNPSEMRPNAVGARG